MQHCWGFQKGWGGGGGGVLCSSVLRHVLDVGQGSCIGHKWVRFASPQLAPTTPATTAFIANSSVSPLDGASFACRAPRALAGSETSAVSLFSAMLLVSCHLLCLCCTNIQGGELPFATAFGFIGLSLSQIGGANEGQRSSEGQLAPASLGHVFGEGGTIEAEGVRWLGTSRCTYVCAF